jgi:RNA-directed DNA polymerase
LASHFFHKKGGNGVESAEKKKLPAFVNASLVKNMRGVNKFHRIKTEPKKSGGVRIIHAPNEELKTLQGTLLDFLYLWNLPFNFFGFMKDKNVVDNALCHFARLWGLPEWLINIDLKNAFPSVTTAMLRKTLRRMFEQLGFSQKKKIPELGNITINQFREIFLQCVAYRGRLRQGPPTSPYLLNLVLYAEGILFGIEEVCKNANVGMVNISIYADDISITLFKKPSRELMDNIIAAIERGGDLKVNRKKVRTNSCKYLPHEITGLKVIVDENGLIHATLRQRKRNELRGMIHRATKIVQEGRKPTKAKDGFTVEVIKGHIAWLNMVYRGRMPSDIRGVVESFKLALQSH